MSQLTKRRIGALALTSAVALALAGCSTAETETEAPEVSTTITGDDVTLSMVYFDDPPGTELIDAFTDKHPNVTIDAQHIPFSDYVTSIKLSLNSNEAPDIAQYNAGAMRPLIKAGLIKDLSPWSDAYGWTEKFPESNLRMLTADEKAETFGVGNLYAVPAGTKFVGLYYNADILAQAGITEAPQTMDEMTEALAAVTAAGYRGLSVGGMETGIVHLWAAMQDAFNEPADFEKWVFGQDGASIVNDGTAAATDLLAEWSAKGYIVQGASAVSDADAMAEFVGGKSAFIMSGNWAAKGVSEGIGDAAGFVSSPVEKADGARIATAGSLAYSISAKSENANVAAAFLDFMASEEAAQIQINAGLMPVGVGTNATAEGLSSEILTAYNGVVEGHGVVAFPDFATTGMLDVLKSGLQGVLAGKTLTADFLASLQKEWDSVHA